MLQINLTQKTMYIALISMGCFFSACSPKAEGVRGQVKSGQTNLNPNLTAQSNIQASAAGANFQIKSVTAPIANDTGGFDIDVELTSPANQPITFRTHHDQNAMETQGNYNDPSGFQLTVQARCSLDNCSKYLLLVTVQKNSQKQFQTGAISFSTDCSFYTVSIAANVAPLLQSLNDFEMRYPASPMGACQQ